MRSPFICSLTIVCFLAVPTLADHTPLVPADFSPPSVAKAPSIANEVALVPISELPAQPEDSTAIKLIPEPSTVAMAGLASMFGLAALLRKRWG